MSDKMVALATFANSVEAELVRATLEGEGIRAVVLGETSGGLFAGMGVGMAPVQVLVSEGDLERATALLDEAEDEDEEAGAEEGSTAIMGEPDRKESPTQVRAPVESPLQERPPAPEGPAEDTPPPETDEGPPPGEEDEREERSVSWTADDVAARAFRAAIFGFLICPLGFVHLYALWLIIRLTSAEGELSPAGSRKAWAAFVISILPALFAVLLFVGIGIGLVSWLLR